MTPISLILLIDLVLDIDLILAIMNQYSLIVTLGRQFRKWIKMKHLKTESNLCTLENGFQTFT